MNETTHIWEQVLEKIKEEVSNANYATWFKDARIVRNDMGTVYISLPNQFVKEWVERKYHTLILKTLRELTEGIRSIEYLIARDTHILKNMPGINPTPDTLPLDTVYVDKESNLNTRYTFDSFVVGSFNELAHAASQQVVRNLGMTYNPLFIYGKTGHGKTHLIQAVGNAVKEQNQNKKIYYITSEKFGQELVTALQSNRINSFKERYRQYDVFIVDDIQFMSNKEKMQEELFHLFNALYENNKQIIFSSDQHPNFIPGLEERLKSRFNAGMVVDISAPDRDSRIAILKSKITAIGFSMTEDVVDFVAGMADGNVRELEGMLNTIICQSQLKQKDLTVSEVKTLLKNNSKPRKMIPIEEVVKKISSFYNVPEDSIYKKSRKKEVVKPRQLIMYILREDFSMAYPSIGQKLGKRDHTTVIHSYEKIKKELETDSELEQEINQIRALL